MYARSPTQVVIGVQPTQAVIEMEMFLDSDGRLVTIIN